MNKRGFTFIETIITVIILSSSLLLVYNSYSSIINNEQERLYYNDPSFLYRTSHISKFLMVNTSLREVIKDDFKYATNKYVQQIGTNYTDIFTEEYQKPALEKIISNFHVSQMFIVKKAFFNTCKFDESSDTSICKSSIKELGSLKKYARTLNDVAHDYYLLVEYVEMSNIEDGENKGKLIKCDAISELKYGCHYYYAYMPIDVE